MTQAAPAPTAWILTPREHSEIEIWGIPPVERLRRALVRADSGLIRTLGPGETITAWGGGSAVVLSSDWIYDERLIQALLTKPGTVLRAPGPGRPAVAAHVPSARLSEVAAELREGRAPGDLQHLGPDELAPAYTAQLRKFEPAFLYPARPELIRSIEARTFAAAYKGATDLVTKWVWPLPARAVTRRLAAAHVHPNSVTAASWVLAVAALWLFAEGAFLSGLAAAWGMTFLDTVDGKLARVTLTSSRFGHIFDHSLDLLHPPFWWFAWGVGIAAPYGIATWIVIAGYFLGRLQEGIFIYSFKMETHCWRPIDTLFRTITARRNPNLLLLSVGAISGRPDLGMLLVALWTVASAIFHTLRIVQAFAARRRGETIEPWDQGLEISFRPIVGSGQAEAAR